VPANNYTPVERFFHRVSLELPWVSEMAFDIETKLITPRDNYFDVTYVTGLARSGTTALMRAIHSTGEFASLTYGDMPFVLSPNIWGKLSAPYFKKGLLTERAHGDGIEVDFSSPEAFEEVFWRVLYGKEYIEKDILRTHEASIEVLEHLHNYQRLICHKYSKSRYLSKNNNFILRISSVAKQNPDDKFLVMYRNPIDQANSLLNQHNRFSNISDFDCNYMKWLAHHEFGDPHRPFYFSEENSYEGSVNNVEYWLHRWVDAYAYLLEVFQEGYDNIIPVSYERLCNDNDYWVQLCNKLSLKKEQSPFRRVSTDTSHALISDSELTLRASEIYRQMNLLSQDKVFF